MTQKEVVIDTLLKKGFIDNFYSINNRISIRLGAIIFELKKEGWDFKTDMIEKNCHYYVTKKPDKYIRPEDKGKLFI